jgi:hypothetical protein
MSLKRMTAEGKMQREEEIGKKRPLGCGQILVYAWFSP